MNKTISIINFTYQLLARRESDGIPLSPHMLEKSSAKLISK